MSKMHAPVQPVRPVPVISEDHVRALLKAASRADFDAWRDAALPLLHYDAGARLSEIANLRLEDLDTLG